jgi:hypothetical protein
MTGAGPGAGAGPAPANIYMLSEHCDESGAGTPDGSRGWQVEALIERSAEEQLEELISAQDWPAAIKVAQEHSLSADPVHKCAQHQPMLLEDLQLIAVLATNCSGKNNYQRRW